jgi:hypothetical protein
MPYKDPEKQKEAQRRHYAANSGKYIESSRRARDRKRELMKELKSGPCVDCGVSYPYYVMHFDHIGTDKVADVSKLLTLKAWQTVLDEIAKCELVCANCHAERTHQRDSYYTR